MDGLTVVEHKPLYICRAEACRLLHPIDCRTRRGVTDEESRARGEPVDSDGLLKNPALRYRVVQNRIERRRKGRKKNTTPKTPHVSLFNN